MTTEEQDVNVQEVRADDMVEEASLDELAEVADDFEAQVDSAPIIQEDVGAVVVEKSADDLKKAAYYVVFAAKEHEADSINQAVQSVHIARFETRTQLKKVIKSLDDGGYKLIDIVRGRPLSFEIKVKKVSEINIGQ